MKLALRWRRFGPSLKKKKKSKITAEEDFLPSDELLILLTLLNLRTTLLNTHKAKKVSKTRIYLSKHLFQCPIKVKGPILYPF